MAEHDSDLDYSELEHDSEIDHCSMWVMTLSTPWPLLSEQDDDDPTDSEPTSYQTYLGPVLSPSR